MIPLIASGLGLQLFFLLSFPDWEGKAYQLASLGLACAAAAAVFGFLKVLQVRSLLVAATYHLGFLTALLLYFLFTWPCRPLPIQQLGQGYRPSRADAAEGMRRLGFEPDSGLSRALAGLFPKR
ncbi:MAG: hypothetical protein HY924_03720 [Elusimicrobia bacterium]|nr:hypothetical protein [Elusimicrobiota bacterium]